MSIFRGPKEGTLPDGSVVATPGDIAEALTAAQQAQAAAEAAQAAAEATLDNFDDRYLGAKSSDPTVDNDGDALIDGALYYNTVNLITRVYDLSSDSWSDLKPSASDQANINALGPVASQVETVGDNISDVTTVASDLSGTDTIGTVAGSIGNVNATGSDIANVNTVAGELGAGQDVTVVAADLSGTDTVGTVAGSISDVNTVATDLSGTDAIGTVATDIANVNTTATNIADVQVVAADLNETTSDIEVVSGSIADVNSVGANISDVTTVATNVGDVQTVAGIADDVVNLARTDQEVRDLFSGSGDIVYNSSTGEFSFTETPNYTDSDVDAHLSGGTGVTYSTGTISIGQDVGTGADVSFNSVSYDNTNSGLAATDVQGAIDETADETGLALIQDGVDPAVARAVAYNDIGAPVAGGYFAGVIDTIKGTIQANDDYQTGLRYAVIVAPKELEGGRGSSPASGLTTGDLQWDTARTTAGETGTLTRWNGLEATNAIIAKNNTNYQVHDFIEECRSQYPAPATTGGSEWYLPAMDELELFYRNFKPDYADNDTRNFPRNFPGSQPSGTNPSSDPTSPQNSNNPRVPEKTPVIGFRDNEAAAVDQLYYWSTTDADEDGRAWSENVTNTLLQGLQSAAKKDSTDGSVRPVRRVVL